MIPSSVVDQVINTHGVSRQRQRKLSAPLGVFLCVAMNLWARQSLGRVLIKLVKGLRLIWPDPSFKIANKSAISQLRYHIGAAPLVDLFHRVCIPMAKPDTPGAFLFGLRMMAIDSTTEDVQDTPANDRVFGRSQSQYRAGAFPQVRCVYLAEVGTHGIVDAGIWPVHTAEQSGAYRLLRSISDGMLVMWDRGLQSFDMMDRTRKRGAHFLARLPDHVNATPVKYLSDSTYLADLQPSDYQRRKAGEKMQVRILEYTLKDPQRPGYLARHRIVTSLTDPDTYPAIELICAYHERWEIELCIDEMDTHQRLSKHPLRSQKPIGVIQELYGLLIAHYLIRKVMFDAAQQVGEDPDRFSFINALELICDAISDFQVVRPESHPLLYQRLLDDIRQFRLPPRDNRYNPRVVKRIYSKYPVQPPKPRNTVRFKIPFRLAVELLN